MDPNPLQKYFDHIYLINLKRRPEKLTKVLWGLSKYHIHPHVIEAVDGYHPDIFYLQKEIPAGAYAYFLTWRQIVDDIKDHQYHRVLILDDDVILIKDFLEKWQHWINKRPKNWQILLLGATQHVALPVYPPSEGLDYYPPSRTDGSFAVAFQGEEIIKELHELTHEPIAVKIVDSDILRTLYHRHPATCFVAYPNLMVADVNQSDIREARPQMVLAQKVGWGNLGERYHYPLSKPLVSIIVPCYNGSRTIRRCLTSLRDQTYRPLEIIVVDDASTDRTFRLVCDTFYKWNFDQKLKDVTYTICRNEKNLGCYGARNRGLELAKGDLIGFQDADDISLDYRIEDQVNALLRYNVMFTTTLILRTHLHVLSNDNVKLDDDIRQSRIHLGKYCCKSKVGLVTTLFRREVIEKLGKYLEWKWGADAEYVARLFPNVKKDNGEPYAMMNYLNDHRDITGKHYCVPDVLYLSHEMTEDNLTYQRKKRTLMQK